MASIAILLLAIVPSGSYLEPLRDILAPDGASLMRLSSSQEAVYRLAREAHLRADREAEHEAYAQLAMDPRVDAFLRAGFLVEKANLEEVCPEFGRAVTTLEDLKGLRLDMPEVLLYADLEIAYDMNARDPRQDAAKAGDRLRTGDNGVSFSQVEQQYDRIFSSYTPYHSGVIMSHLDFAGKCMEEAQRNLSSVHYAQVALMHVQEAQNAIGQLQLHPDLAEGGEETLSRLSFMSSLAKNNLRGYTKWKASIEEQALLVEGLALPSADIDAFVAQTFSRMEGEDEPKYGLAEVELDGRRLKLPVPTNAPQPGRSDAGGLKATLAEVPSPENSEPATQASDPTEGEDGGRAVSLGAVAGIAGIAGFVICYVVFRVKGRLRGSR